MTVENTNSTIGYVGNNSQTNFSYNFLVYRESDLFVYLDNVEQTSGYTVAGIGDENGGSITFDAAPGTDVVVTIDRTVPLTQEIEYQEYGPFPAKTNERGLDLGTMADQQLQRDVSRTEQGKMDKIPGATEDNIVVFDSEGNAKDSGVNIVDGGGGVSRELVLTTYENKVALEAQEMPEDSLVKTKGYVTKGDLGASTYLIKTPAQASTDGDVVDGNGNFLIANGNVAVLQHEGEVLLEQFGVVDINATYSDNLHNAINARGVTKVTSTMPSAIFDKIALIEKSGVTIDLLGTEISYIGDYDVYAASGVTTGTDRTIGFINSRGVLGTDTANVTNSIVDGTTVLELDNVAPFSVGDYLELQIFYPRRASGNAKQCARITLIDGNSVTIDYTFAFIVTSCVVTKIDTIRKNNVIKLNLVDNSAAVANENKISGIGLKYTVLTTATWRVSNNNFPACMVDMCADIIKKDGTCFNPKDISAGRGYNSQINNAQRVHCEDLISWRCRHNWDLTNAAYCTIKDSTAYSPTDNISQYTTHGSYEHDFLIEDCYQHDGQNAISIAQSGPEFGSINRRVTIRGGRYNGVAKLVNSKDTLVERVSFYGTQVSEFELSGTEGTIFRDVDFGTVFQVRIKESTEQGGPEGQSSDADFIRFDNVNFNNNITRYTGQRGAIEYLNCRNINTITVGSTPIAHHTLEFKRTPLTINSSWELQAVKHLKFEDCDIALTTFNTSNAGEEITMSGGSVTSNVVNTYMNFEAPSVSCSDVVTKKSAGFRAQPTCTNFSLTNIKSIEPDANHTTHQFTTSGDSNCHWTMSGMNIEYIGSGISLLFNSSSLSVAMSGSYVEGTIQENSRLKGSFSGNVTPNHSFSDIPNTQTGTAYTLSVTDDNRTIWMDNAAANILTIDSDSNALLPINTVILVMMLGDGVTSITSVAGVTINGIDGGTGSLEKYKGVTLVKRAANTWVATPLDVA